MLSEELLRDVRLLQLRSRRLASDQLAGEFASTFHGQGIDFDELREYVPGDDVRAIDWNVTARSTHPYVKVFREDREMTFVVILDRSASFDFGSGRRSKKDTATQVAALLAYLTSMTQDRVGLLTFTDKVEAYIPPKKGKAHVWHVLRTIYESKNQHKKTNLAGALDYLTTRYARKATVFVISDFFSDDFSKSLKRIATKHELVGICIRDDAETTIPDVGLCQFFDQETGQEILVNTSDLKGDRSVKIIKSFKESRAKLITITTNDSIGIKLREGLGGMVV